MNLRQREPRYENRALLDAVYQIPCMADWPHDCGPSEPAHSNQERHGKGKSIKAHDCFTAALCRAAHRELDQGRMFSREDKFAYWQRAHERTLLELCRRALLIVRQPIVLTIYPPEPAPERSVSPDGQRSAGPNKRLRSFSAKTGHRNGSSTRSPSNIFPRGQR